MSLYVTIAFPSGGAVTQTFMAEDVEHHFQRFVTAESFANTTGKDPYIYMFDIGMCLEVIDIVGICNLFGVTATDLSLVPQTPNTSFFDMVRKQWDYTIDTANMIKLTIYNEGGHVQSYYGLISSASLTQEGSLENIFRYKITFSVHSPVAAET